ncbi:hypothetical protein M8J75_002394 [Diaphorina citri]|nr:hypothetical protein M8J75_002394 [Diaphorina citri]
MRSRSHVKNLLMHNGHVHQADCTVNMCSSSGRLHGGHVQFIRQTAQWTCAVHQADYTVDMCSSSGRLHSGHVQFIRQTAQWTCAVHQADCTVKVNMGSSSDRLHSGHVQFIRHTACRLNMRWANAHTHNPYYKYVVCLFLSEKTLSGK